MWIKFRSMRPFAIKVYAGAINVISGEHRLDEADSMHEHMRDVSNGKRRQGSIVSPDQRWIDGVATGLGDARQFVATPINSGYSLEAQISGSDSLSAMRVEIIPSKTDYTFEEVLSTKKTLSV